MRGNGNKISNMVKKKSSRSIEVTGQEAGELNENISFKIEGNGFSPLNFSKGKKKEKIRTELGE